LFSERYLLRFSFISTVLRRLLLIKIRLAVKLHLSAYRIDGVYLPRQVVKIQQSVDFQGHPEDDDRR